MQKMKGPAQFLEPLYFKLKNEKALQQAAAYNATLISLPQQLSKTTHQLSHRGMGPCIQTGPVSITGTSH